MKRRKILKNIAFTAAAPFALGTACAAAKQNSATAPMKLKANIKQSVCRWCFSDMPLEELADFCKELGMFSIELLNENEWKTVQDRGLTCAVATGGISLTQGFNNPKNHAKLQAFYPDLIRKAAAAGLPNVICFSGNRNGITDEEGLENCAVGLEPLVKLAEKEGINLIMEVFNSKIDHPDYQADSTKWAVDLCKKTGSERMKILYDIYHMQIMEGDIIRTIQEYHPYFAHYHTAGVPGRNEIDTTQELYYPAIVEAIIKTGYTGYLGQEFIPTKEPKLQSLREAVLLCDV